MPSTPASRDQDGLIAKTALLLAGLSVGQSRIAGTGQSHGLECLATALRLMGVSLERTDDDSWVVNGVGIGGLHEPDDALVPGTDNATLILMLGITASHPVVAVFSGPPASSQPSLGEMMVPLKRIGATIQCNSRGGLPLRLQGPTDAMPVEHSPAGGDPAIAAALLLSGLNARGRTAVSTPDKLPEPLAHLFRHFGADIRTGQGDDGRFTTSVAGHPELRGTSLDLTSF